jgi:hypothetical protein
MRTTRAAHSRALKLPLDHDEPALRQESETPLDQDHNLVSFTVFKRAYDARRPGDLAHHAIDVAVKDEASS